MIPRSACRVSIRPSPVQSLPPVLPWLAPAQLRWLASQPLSTTDRTARKSISRCERSTTSRSRRIATTQLHESTPVHSDIPFDTRDALAGTFNAPGQGMWQGLNGGTSILDPTAMRRSSPIIDYEAASANSQSYRLNSRTKHDGLDMLQHLYTSLMVGRFDRAKAIIHRLALSNEPDAPDLVQAHKIYLETSFRSLCLFEKQSQASQDAYRAMQSWFATEVEAKGVKVDANHLIPMVRGAIHALEEEECNVNIRKYAEVASAAGETVFDDVLFSEEFDDAEYSTLIAATSDYFEDGELPSSEDLHQDVEQHHADQSRAKQVVDLAELPKVRDTSSLGPGLRGVQDTVAALHELPALPLDATPEEQRQRAMDRQRISEEAAVDIALRRWQDADAQLRKIGINTAMQTKPINALMWQWYSALLPELEAELEACRDTANTKRADPKVEADRAHYALFLETMPLPQLAANTILLVLSKLVNSRTDREGLEVAVTSLVLWLSRELQSEVAANFSKTDKRGIASKNSLSRRKGSRLAVQRRRRAASSGHSDQSEAVDDNKPTVTFTAWPQTVQVKLGTMLVEKLIETAKLPVTRPHPRTGQRVTQLQPAFIHRTKYKQGARVGLLCANTALVAKLESEPVGSMLAKYLPMVVEPRPWQGFADGGFYHHPLEIIRTSRPTDGAKDHFVAADKRGDVDRIYAGLNALSKVPWRINHDVFRVQLEAWNSGEAVANLAPLNLVVPVPPEPDASAGPDARRNWLRTVRDAENKKSGNHSQRCFQNFQMEVARAMLNETMYFPHNLDFRGRAYPIPPYLNHMGADNVRALLVFAEGKELGVEGLRWLKIHLANVAGNDKASLQEREDYTMAHIEEIRDSAHDPMGGKQWWLKSEDAWQTLAACCELTRALDSPDPTKYVSHLPIHQDGTCNGLQHYAALGGDKIGAALVNLEPGERPADVYSGVATSVAEAVERDAAAGHPVAQAVQGHISRKVVKQTVMTNVYGVTAYGARAQVQKQLEDVFPNVTHLSEFTHPQMARYLVEKIFNSLGTLFTGAQAIQRWLEACAGRISTCVTPEQVQRLLRQHSQAQQAKPSTKKQKAAKKPSKASGDLNPVFKSTVVWTTPLSLPVVQPYRSTNKRVMHTRLQTITLQDPQMWDPVKRKKQMQAFPPNFIHSLDATHMLMSAIMCDEVGMTFASIHDSFWTHACDISRMSTLLRDAFVAMHSENVIGRLREEFETRYKGSMYLAPIRADSAALNYIRVWRKKNKVCGGAAEFKLEVERIRLLRSADSEDRIKGRQMVTPGAILEAFDSEDADQIHAMTSTDELQSAHREYDTLAADEAEDMGWQSEEMLAEDDETADAIEAGESQSDEHDVQGRTSESHVKDVVDTTTTATVTNNGDDTAGAPVKGKRQRSPRKYFNSPVWLPLTFPEVPAKGDFDVTRLRQSKYFFH